MVIQVLILKVIQNFIVSKFQEIYETAFNKRKCIDIIVRRGLILKFPIECLNKMFNKICGGNK